MAKLKAANLVAERREGRWVHYRLQPDPDQQNAELFKILDRLTLIEPYAEDRTRLEAYLQDKSAGACSQSVGSSEGNAE